MSIVAPGVCRHCGCTEEHACCLRTGDTCAWTDRTRTVCNGERCVLAEADRMAKAKRENAAAPSRFKGWGFGAIRAELNREQRRARRKKGQAA